MSSSKVGILTSFASFPPGYSLTGIVEDQIRMLASYGHEVHLFVCEHFSIKPEEELFQHDPWMKDQYILHKVVPFAHLKDYISADDITSEHHKIIKKTSKILLPLLRDMEVIFTHDWIFTGWNMIYGKAIQLLCEENREVFLNIGWMHWVHSIPTQNRDWWNLSHYKGKHRIIYPNKIDSQRVAEAYKCPNDHVVVIPHIKDMRSFWEFGKNTYEFIEDFPAVMQSSIVQVYPASTDRLSAKGIDKILHFFKHFKENGATVCFVICNQWATGRQRKESLQSYYKRVRLANLKINEEVIFTSEWKKDYETGIPRKMLRELQLLSNLFIYPTTEETFGLVGPEVAVAGPLMVNNRSLSMMWEVQGGTGVFAEFGSFERRLDTPGSEKEYYKALAMLVLSRMQRNEVVTAKTYNRRRYNWDHIYKKYYGPTMAERLLW
jgi:glycosyltransferase involved in cell wall biosynthesis